LKDAVFRKALTTRQIDITNKKNPASRRSERYSNMDSQSRISATILLLGALGFTHGGGPYPQAFSLF